MSQISKLYKFYLKKIFKKNWLRITIVSLFLLVVVWFGLPYLVFKGAKESISKHSEELKRDPDISEEDKKKIEEYQAKIKEVNFRNYNRWGFGDAGVAIIRKIRRSQLEKSIKFLGDQKKAGASEGDLKKIKGKIEDLEFFDSGKYGGFDILLFNSNNCFFFSHTDGYEKGKGFWKLLNDISWWNLTGLIVTFYLFFNILDSIFFHPQKDGEEVMVLSFTPGVKRSDLFFAKIFAFLTFFMIINVFLFLLPYGFYYFWAGSNIFLGTFVLLSLYTTVIGPILYFGLIFAPYIFTNAWLKLAGSIFSSLLAFFSTIWWIGKKFAFPFHTWPYTVEEKFFDPAIFTIISVICGVVFLSLYYWKYQEEDLGN